MDNSRNKNKSKNLSSVAKLETQVKELQEKLSRSLADYANLQKRHEDHRQVFATLAITGFVSQMLEVLDEFLLTYKHLPNPGLKIAIEKFENVLKNQGLEEINLKNADFDPQIMECIEVVKGPDNKVVEVKKRGYLLNGQCLRPAQVAVGKN